MSEFIQDYDDYMANKERDHNHQLNANDPTLSPCTCGNGTMVNGHCDRCGRDYNAEVHQPIPADIEPLSVTGKRYVIDCHISVKDDWFLVALGDFATPMTAIERASALSINPSEFISVYDRESAKLVFLRDPYRNIANTNAVLPDVVIDYLVSQTPEPIPPSAAPSGPDLRAEFERLVDEMRELDYWDDGNLRQLARINVGMKILQFCGTNRAVIAAALGAPVAVDDNIAQPKFKIGDRVVRELQLAPIDTAARDALAKPDPTQSSEWGGIDNPYTNTATKIDLIPQSVIDLLQMMEKYPLELDLSQLRAVVHGIEVNVEDWRYLNYSQWVTLSNETFDQPDHVYRITDLGRQTLESYRANVALKLHNSTESK